MLSANKKTAAFDDVICCGQTKTTAFDDVICCGQTKTKAFDDPEEYMLRATKITTAFVDFLFLIIF